MKFVMAEPAALMSPNVVGQRMAITSGGRIEARLENARVARGKAKM